MPVFVCDDNTLQACCYCLLFATQINWTWTNSVTPCDGRAQTPGSHGKFHSAEFLIWTCIINNKVPFPKDNQVLHVKPFQILEWLIHTLGAQDSWFFPHLPPNIIQETSGQGVSLGHIGKTQDWIMGLHLQSTSVFSLVNPDSYWWAFYPGLLLSNTESMSHMWLLKIKFIKMK